MRIRLATFRKKGHDRCRYVSPPRSFHGASCDVLVVQPRPPASRIVRMAVPLDVEAALPTEWHESPVALDPLEPVPRD